MSLHVILSFLNSSDTMQINTMYTCSALTQLREPTYFTYHYSLHQGRGEHVGSGGLLPPCVLGDVCAAFISTGVAGGAAAMLPVWDYFLVR
jgi:hypothetical protein